MQPIFIYDGDTFHRIMNEIESKIEVLKQFPEIGRQSEKEKGVRRIKVAKQAIPANAPHNRLMYSTQVCNGLKTA